MARGEESLELELRRRRARSEDEREAIPTPPGSHFQTPADVEVQILPRSAKGAPMVVSRTVNAAIGAPMVGMGGSQR